MWAPPRKQGNFTAVWCLCPLGQPQEEEYSVSTAKAAASARREVVCGYAVLLCLLLWLLCQREENKHVCSSYGPLCLLPSSARTLPTPDSANSTDSVNSKTTGVTNSYQQYNNVICFMATTLYFYFWTPYNMLTIQNLVSISHHITDPLNPSISSSLPSLPHYVTSTLCFVSMCLLLYGLVCSFYFLFGFF